MKNQFENITPHQAETFEVGAILHDSWGYEQTNVDFYCIVSRKGNWVNILPMKKSVSGELSFQSMSNHNTPTVIDFSEKPLRRMVKIGKKYKPGQELGFSVRGYGWCDLWDGKPATSTSYA